MIFLSIVPGAVCLSVLPAHGRTVHSTSISIENGGNKITGSECESIGWNDGRTPNLTLFVSLNLRRTL